MQNFDGKRHSGKRFFEKGWLAQERGCASQVNYHKKRHQGNIPKNTTCTQSPHQYKKLLLTKAVPSSFSSHSSNYHKNTPNFRNNSENSMTKREIFQIWG